MKTRYPAAYVLNVVAEDRPGIVAAVSKAVVDCAGNIDACSQTVLAEYFTLIMIVSFPGDVDPDALRQAVIGSRACAESQALQVGIRPYHGSALAPPVPEAEHFVLTAFGADREGITLKFSAFLADKGINISDLYGLREGDQFILVGQVQVPRRWDVKLLQAELEHMASEIGHTVRLQHENIFVATNQLRPPHAARRTKGPRDA
jgi:glycine cleavage system transcriptional repressor